MMTHPSIIPSSPKVKKPLLLNYPKPCAKVIQVYHSAQQVFTKYSRYSQNTLDFHTLSNTLDNILCRQNEVSSICTPRGPGFLWGGVGGVNLGVSNGGGVVQLVLNMFPQKFPMVFLKVVPNRQVGRQHHPFYFPKLF